MATLKTPKQKGYNIQEISIALVVRSRFYASILAKMTKIEYAPVKTMGVGFNKEGKLMLMYNSEWLNSLTITEAHAVLEHEALHIFYRHFNRIPRKQITITMSHADIEKAKAYNDMINTAQDLAINQYVKGLPKCGCFVENFGLPRDKTSEWYFEELKKMAKCPKCGKQVFGESQQGKDKDNQKQQGKGQGQDEQDQDDEQQGQGQGQGDDEQDEQQGQGQGQGQDEQDQEGQGQGQGCDDGLCNCQHRQDEHGTGKGQLDSHEFWDKIIDGDQITEAKELGIDIEYELNRIIDKVIKESEKHGDTPSFLKNYIETLKAKKRHDWKHELRVFVNSVLSASKRLSQKRVNRRLATAWYVMPGKKKSRHPSILVARDTSGSMYDEATQKELLNEMISISKFCDVHVADCDTIIHQDYKVRKVSDFKQYKGGGGTSFEPIFKLAKKLGVDGIIYLTDTEGSFPRREDIGKLASHTIWVTFDQKTVNTPFGKHVNIETR